MKRADIKHHYLKIILCFVALFAFSFASSYAIADTRYDIMDLGTLGGDSSRAVELNNPGQVVGSSKTESGDSHAFLWFKETGMMDLGTLGGNLSFGNAINDYGQVVGWSESESESGRPFLWKDGFMSSPWTGVYNSEATDINNLGQITIKDGPNLYLLENGEKTLIHELDDWGAYAQVPT